MTICNAELLNIDCAKCFTGCLRTSVLLIHSKILNLVLYIQKLIHTHPVHISTILTLLTQTMDDIVLHVVTQSYVNLHPLVNVHIVNNLVLLIIQT